MRFRCFPIVLALVTMAQIVSCARPGETPTTQSESQPPTEEPTAIPSATPKLEPTIAPPSPTPTAKPSVASPSPTQQTGVGYPLPTEPQVSSYPEPGQEETIALPTRDPNYRVSTPMPAAPVPGKGTVTGVITRDVRGLPLEPKANTKLYLAKMITETGDPVALARLNEEEAPSTLTNDSGQFIFVDIEPGKYALIVKTPLSPVLAHDVATGEDVLVDVVPGEVAELGDIHVSITF